MKNKTLLRKENQFLRVLKTDEERVLIIDCIKKTMPKWIKQEDLKEFSESSEQELLNSSNTSLLEKDELSENSKRIMLGNNNIVIVIITNDIDYDIDNIITFTIRFFL